MTFRQQNPQEKKQQRHSTKVRHSLTNQSLHRTQRIIHISTAKKGDKLLRHNTYPHAKSNQSQSPVHNKQVPLNRAEQQRQTELKRTPPLDELRAQTPTPPTTLIPLIGDTAFKVLHQHTRTHTQRRRLRPRQKTPGERERERAREESREKDSLV